MVCAPARRLPAPSPRALLPVRRCESPTVPFRYFRLRRGAAQVRGEAADARGDEAALLGRGRAVGDVVRGVARHRHLAGTRPARARSTGPREMRHVRIAPLWTLGDNACTGLTDAGGASISRALAKSLALSPASPRLRPSLLPQLAAPRSVPLTASLALAASFCRQLPPFASRSCPALRRGSARRSRCSRRTSGCCSASTPTTPS